MSALRETKEAFEWWEVGTISGPVLHRIGVLCKFEVLPASTTGMRQKNPRRGKEMNLIFGLGNV